MTLLAVLAALLTLLVPGCAIAVVVDNSAPGSNRKAANLASMLAAARHDVLVIADSDMHAAPDYLRRIAAALPRPKLAGAALWQLPLRDLMSVVVLASYLGDRVEWRGRSLRVAAPGLAASLLRIGQAP